MMRIDDKQIRQYEADLKTFARSAFPFATKATVNKAAFTGRAIAQDVVKGKMIERNRFTKQSIRVEQARTLVVSQQQAVLGSIADYLETQEFGGTIQAKGRKGRPIPTPRASGETALPRRKLPRKPNKLQNIQLRKGARPGANRKAKNRAAVMEAAQRGGRSKFVYLDLGRHEGIYKVMGSKKRPRIRKMYDLSRKTVTVPARPWLKPATDKAAAQLPRYYRDALRFQLQRHNVFGYR